MKAIRLGVFGAVLLYWVPATPAQLPDLPPAAQEVIKQYEEESAEVEKKIETDVKARRDKTVEELKKVQDALCKEAKLDEAVAVRDLIRSFDAGGNGTGADLPAAAQEVLKVHEDQVAEIHKKVEARLKERQDKVAAELKKVQDAYCKDAKLDEAVAVRDLIRAIRDGVSNALADPGYINNANTDIGKVLYYTVTGVAQGQSIYGSDVYTTGSHLGMAAVHCGILKNGQKGVVKVTILPGQQNYAATTRHGVTSYGYSSWGVSFKVERIYGFLARPVAVKVGQAALPDPGTLTGLRTEVGKTMVFEVTGSNTGSVWGTDVYTDDSSLATAAVHAGVLAVGQKGVVKVSILGGQNGYESSTRNGITSGTWGSWVGSFRVEAAK